MFTILPHISRIVLACSCGFVCGVFVASFFDLAIDVIFFLCFFFSLLILLVGHTHKRAWFSIIFLICFSGGVFVTVTHIHNMHIIIDHADRIKNGRATVVEDIDQKGWYSSVAVRYSDEDFMTIVKDEKHTMLSRGDVLEISCVRDVVSNFEDFDYQMYLAMHRVYFVCDEFSYNVVDHHNTMLSTIAQARRVMENIVAGIIPAPESALANGLLFGGSDRLSKDAQNKFAQTGMTHIVAVSGYNVSIIVAVVMGTLIFVGLYRHYAVVGAIIAVIFFVALIGFPASGIRAAIMGVLVLVAASYGRVAHAYGAIIVSAAVMLLFNPLLLRYDIGFQLSFLATLGIVVVYPFFERYFMRRNIAFGIVEVFLLTLSAQVFVLPIIAYHFHTISIVSLVVNVLVLPIIPPTMLFVFLLIIANFIFYPLAVFFGWVAYLLLTYEVYVIDFFANLPWNSVVCDDISVGWIVGYYGIVGSIIIILSRKNRLYEI